MKIHSVLAVFAACAAISLPACTVSGTFYPDAKKAGLIQPKKDKALVIVYMKPGFSSAADQFKVYANDQLLSDKMRRPVFCSYDATPGQVRLSLSAATASTDTRRDVVNSAIIGGGLGALIAYSGRKRERAVIDAISSETYFAELNNTMKIKVVSKEEGEREIQKSHWVNLPTN